MHAENIWKWLDAVDQNHLDPLDQWGVQALQHCSRKVLPRSDIILCDRDGKSSQQHNGERNGEAASPLKSTTPSGILLRNGSTRVIGPTSTCLAYNVDNDNHHKPLVSGFPKKVALDVKSENCPQSVAPGITTTSEATHQRADASSTPQPQSSGREGNGVSVHRKRLPTYAEKARAPAPSGDLQSVPMVQVGVINPVAVECQGAKVVGGYQRNGLRTLLSTKSMSRRHTSAEEGALHRSNALRRPSNVRKGSNLRGNR